MSNNVRRGLELNHDCDRTVAVKTAL